MPLTKQEIKARNNPSETYVSPHHGDGGWHTTPGCQQFTTEWTPRNDRILVRLFRERNNSLILRPEIAALETSSRRGVILKAGPGKWIDGAWRKTGVLWCPDENGIQQSTGGEWEYIAGHRQPMMVRVGDEVIIGRWHDWSSLEAGWGEEIALCQEADCRVVLA
jgi:hypothetical protein